MDERLWYIAYGSNLQRQRFGCYLAGGRPEGGAREYPGCRDPRDPAETAGIAVPGGIYFAGESRVWGGGMAFYDRAAPGVVAARAYLVTLGQFSDIAAQEMRREPGIDLDLFALGRADPGHSEQHRFGPGHYETVVSVGTRAGLPMVTITAAIPAEMVLAAPSRAYLRVISAGLTESHRWQPDRIGRYLAAAPGAAPTWTSQRIEDVARQQ